MIDTNAISCMIWKNFVLEALELWIDEFKGCGDFEEFLDGWDESGGASVGLKCFGESVLQIRFCNCLILWGTRLDCTNADCGCVLCCAVFCVLF